jgi:putative membrane-bound dehydrogenase-like protein
MRTVFVAISLIAFELLSCSKPDQPVEHSPETSLADLKVHDGLDVGLFASEPMFSNPTNISVDARGRVWVCEAYNYRNELNPKNPVKKEGDRIMILEDTDGDGKADKSKIFYQGTDVNAALGICVLGNRIFVSCSPNVFVFTDENGDDIPDKKEVLFTGIHGEQHDHGMHTFTFGPDGRLYFNLGNEGKLLLSPEKDTITDIHGRKVFTNGKPFRQGLAIRAELDGSKVEVIGHNFRNNYELAVDPFGTVWQTDNDDDGNKSTRVNYVMEQGNYGYSDELTGAGWSMRRTNIEKQIPSRHWHLNDPGVVPNVLHNGAGSPAGLTYYEGDLLPEVFRGQLIHAEPGQNVVRAYAVENDGAGYKGEIVKLLEGQKDQWFRPVDVATGPDGSLFVADWYDPGVGGHQVGDLDRGRIYRLAPAGTTYTSQAVDLRSSGGAVKALLNPNMDIRYQGWTALAAMGDEAEAELSKLWRSENKRQRAQALWLLTKLESVREKYFNEAIADADPDIRITALRCAKRYDYKLPELCEKLASDGSAQVRREVALSIKGNNTAKAASIWTRLAQQYDGKDRWYLEALGISAYGNWDLYFSAWLKSAGKSWNNEANRDIVWRSRSRHALPLLAELIAAADNEEMLRYFRAFDFHDHPTKQNVLAGLVERSDDEKLVFALKHMDPSKVKVTPVMKAKLSKVLDIYKGKIEFVELSSSFGLKEKSNDLLDLAVNYPDSVAGKEAVKVLVNWDRSDLIEKVVYGKDNEKAQNLIKALSSEMGNRGVMSMMEKLLMDTTKDAELRKQVVRSFIGPWEAEDRLLAMAKDKKIPKDLHLAAAGALQTAWRANIREGAAKYLQMPGTKGAAALPSISILAEKEGNSGNGKEVFKNVCSNCHRVGGEGVDFGPDLTEIGDKLPKEALYKAILFPDQGISFGYEAYQVKLKDGSQAFGRILSETEENIEIQYLNTRQTVKKSEVVSRTVLTNSLMPNNLQATMTEAELVDLVQYLSELRKKDLAQAAPH